MSTPALTREELADRLVDTLRHLRTAADDGAGWPARDASFATFMPDLFEIGRAVTVTPELRDEADVTLFLSESALLLNRHHVLVDRYAWATEELVRLAGEVGGEWDRVVVRRSALAFLDELYVGTIYEGFVDVVELGEVDMILRRLAGQGPMTTEPVPDGIPPSHWWWRPAGLTAS